MTQYHKHGEFRVLVTDWRFSFFFTLIFKSETANFRFWTINLSVYSIKQFLCGEL